MPDQELKAIETGRGLVSLPSTVTKLEAIATVMAIQRIAAAELTLINGAPVLTGLYDGLLYLDSDSVVMNFGKSLVSIQELLHTLRETSSVADTAEKCGVGVQDVMAFLCHQADIQDRPAHILLGWEYFSWGGKRIDPKAPLPPAPEPWYSLSPSLVPVYVSEPFSVGDDKGVFELEYDIPF